MVVNDFSACFVCLVSFSFGGIIILAVFKGLGKWAFMRMGSFAGNFVGF